MRRRSNSIGGVPPSTHLANSAVYRRRREKFSAQKHTELDDLTAFVLSKPDLEGDENTVDYYSDDEGEIDELELKQGRKKALRAVRAATHTVAARAQKIMHPCVVHEEKPISIEREPGKIFLKIEGLRNVNSETMAKARSIYSNADTEFEELEVMVRDEKNTISNRKTKLISFNARKIIAEDRESRLWSLAATIAAGSWTLALGLGYDISCKLSVYF